MSVELPSWVKDSDQYVQKAYDIACKISSNEEFVVRSNSDAIKLSEKFAGMILDFNEKYVNKEPYRLTEVTNDAKGICDTYDLMKLQHLINTGTEKKLSALQKDYARVVNEKNALQAVNRKLEDQIEPLTDKITMLTEEKKKSDDILKELEKELEAEANKLEEQVVPLANTITAITAEKKKSDNKLKEIEKALIPYPEIHDEFFPKKEEKNSEENHKEDEPST